MTHTNRKKLFSYIILILVGILMIYPLIWLFFSSFKSNQEIFTSISLFPKKWDFSGYINGWNGTGQYSFGRFLMNTFMMVLPTVLVTMVSSTIVAYGFASIISFIKVLFFTTTNFQGIYFLQMVRSYQPLKFLLYHHLIFLLQ